MIMTGLKAQSRRGGDHTKWSRTISLFIQSPPGMAEISPATPRNAIKALPFDSFHVKSINAYQNVFSTTPLNQAAMIAERDAFEAQDWGNMEFILHIQTGGSYGNFGAAGNAYFTQSAANLATIGTVFGNRPKIIGMAWDWEYYFGSPYWFNYPGAAGSLGTLGATHNLVKSRFAQLMNGLLSTWPGVQITTSHGAGSGTTANYHYLGAPTGYGISHNDVAFANELMSSAFVGMQNAVFDAGRHAVLHDGGELYGMRNQADANRIRWWQQVRLKDNPNEGGTWDADMLNASDAPKFHPASTIGLYDRNDYPSGTGPEGLPIFAVLPASVMPGMISSAMRQAGSHVWFYVEHYNWVAGVGGKPGGAVPSDMLAAVTEGIRLGRL